MEESNKSTEAMKAGATAAVGAGVGYGVGAASGITAIGAVGSGAGFGSGAGPVGAVVGACLGLAAFKILSCSSIVKFSHMNFGSIYFLYNSKTSLWDKVPEFASKTMGQLNFDCEWCAQAHLSPSLF